MKTIALLLGGLLVCFLLLYLACCFAEANKEKRNDLPVFIIW